MHIYLQETMNVSTKSHGETSNSCWDISKAMDWSTPQHGYKKYISVTQTSGKTDRFRCSLDLFPLFVVSHICIDS